MLPPLERLLSWITADTRDLGSRRPGTRPMRVEPLEHRRLLAATDMAAITGRVFETFLNDGYSAGEEVAGATVRLYRDDGDSTFDAGDTLAGTGSGAGGGTGVATTDADGQYRFDNLTAGTYFVQQIAQDVGGATLSEVVSSAIVISATDVQGAAGMIVDSFNTTAQSIVAPSATSANPDFNAVDTAAGEAVGNERDLFAELTSGAGTVSLAVLDSGFQTLSFSSSSRGDGTRIVTWDGDDNDGETLDSTGLGGIDLTETGDNTGFQLALGADQDTGAVVIRAYTDATHWSQATAAMPNTGGTPDQTIEVLFSTFSQGAGAVGPATWTNVGAIQLEITSSGTAVDGEIDFIRLIGPTLFNEDFDNYEEADLQLTKTVDNPSPNLGENVVFTLSLANQGPNTARTVTVTDVLPAGLTYVSHVAGAGTTYTSGTGVWNVGTLATGIPAVTLQITATVAANSPSTNTAQVTTADLFDPDSTPGNSVAGEDDQASVTVTPPAIDLELTKIVDNAAPNVGDTVQFTITLNNAGPDGATGVVVTDLLPSGLSYTGNTPSQGTYNPATGAWTVGALAAGNNATLQLTATVLNTGSKTNTAEVTEADQFDSDSTPNNNVASEDDQASISLTPLVADLSLTKTVDDSTPNVGQNVVFTVSVTNSGPDTATGVTVADALPAGLTYVSHVAGAGTTYASGTGVWNVGTLANSGAGATATLQITATVNTTATVTNSAQVSAADQADPDSTPNNSVAGEDDQASASLTALQADLSVSKTVDDAEPDIGQNVVFTVTVQNAGPDAATNVSVTDALPAGLTYVSHVAAAGTTYAAGTGVWNVGTLANGGAGASATLQITATVNVAGTTTNTAQVSAADQADPDSTPGNSVAGEDDQASAAVTPLASVSGDVYVDANNNSTRDAGETGIAGVSLVLTGTNDLGAAVNRSATTAADGSYQFGGLRPSNAAGYTITETQPGTYLDGQEQVGSLGGTAAVPSSLDRISGIVLASGQAGQNYDFGELQPSSISGYVYYDANGDGTRQPAEVGIPGITVTLAGVDDLGAAVSLALTTAADGTYRFSNLRPSGPAGYTLTETQPVGFQDGAESIGTPGLDAALADDVFSSLDLEQGVNAEGFNFAEIIQVISKRRFLASAR